MHRLFRSAGRIAALSALIVGGGTIATIPPAIADIGADMRLVCSGKSGTHEVGLRIDATAPSSGTVGQPVQLGTVRIDLGIPPELAKEVRAGSPGGASTPPVTSVAPSPTASPALGGVAEMQVAVNEPGRDQPGGWPAFALAAVPSRDEGVVHLTGSGVAPPVVPQSRGGLSWSARSLDLSLVPGDTTTGKDAAETVLHCAAEKETRLGTVRVQRQDEAAASGALSAPPSRPAGSQEDLCKEIPARGTDPRYAVNGDTKLMEIYESPPVPAGVTKHYLPGKMMCIKGTGFFNVKKTGNAVPIALESNARMITENFFGNPFTGPNYRELRGYFVNGTYPTPATILGFGFMPTRAVAEAVQVGAPGDGETDPITGNIRLLQRSFPDHTMPGIATDQLRFSSYVRIKAVNAQVNGVPLDLGDQCMTSSTPFAGTAFMGNWRTGLLLYDRGQTVVVEDLKIPSFSGCGVTEDLSPILTASVSGSGNYANAETGTWCDVATGTQCVDGKAPLPPTFTVAPGGDITAVANKFVLNRIRTSPQQAQFGCESAAMRFHFDRGHWQSRFMLAKGDISLDGCKVKASDGAEYPVVETSQEGPLWLSVFQFETDPMILSINGFMLNSGVDVNGDGTADCSLRINYSRQASNIDRGLSGTPGSIVGPYSNGVFSMNGHELEVAPESTCNIPGFTRLNPTQRVQFSQQTESEFVFTPAQRITWDSGP